MIGYFLYIILSGASLPVTSFSKNLTSLLKIDLATQMLTKINKHCNEL